MTCAHGALAWCCGLTSLLVVSRVRFAGRMGQTVLVSMTGPVESMVWLPYSDTRLWGFSTCSQRLMCHG